MSIQILILDDEKIVGERLKASLEKEGHTIEIFIDPVAALNRIREKAFDVVITDIRMDDVDGIQVLEEVRKKSQKTKVIMITGYSTVENAVKSLHKGAIDFIPKPFTFEEIASSINRGLNYRNIKVKFEEAEKCSTNDSVIYVPCPPKYKRMGYMSWVNLEYEGAAVVGVTDLFLETIEDTLMVELMEVDELLIQGSSCAKFETNDGLIHTCLAPLGGRIVERNERIFINPSLLEKDPFFEGWLYRIIPSDIEYDMKYLNACSSDRV